METGRIGKSHTSACRSLCHQIVNKYQRVNHFPGTWELGRKDKLYKNVANMRRSQGEMLLPAAPWTVMALYCAGAPLAATLLPTGQPRSAVACKLSCRLFLGLQGVEFDFVPRFFILPRDMDEFQQHVERNPSAMYIQKPLASSRGRGIKMVVKPKEMARDANCLVQHYIRNPLTIGGYKFDIRLYCVVTCFDPLKVCPRPPRPPPPPPPLGRLPRRPPSLLCHLHGILRRYADAMYQCSTASIVKVTCPWSSRCTCMRTGWCGLPLRSTTATRAP